MKKYIIFFSLVVIFFSGSYSQQSIKQIAVLNLNAAGLNANESNTLTDRLRSELVKTREFRVIEREKMEEILKEQGFQQTGCTADECAVEAGRLLNIQQICAGSIGKVGSLYTVTLRLIDVETGQILATVNEDCNCSIEKVLTTSMKTIAIKLVEESKMYQGFLKTKDGSGSIYLKSDISPAIVSVDGKQLNDRTPTTIKNINAGEHFIKVVKDDYVGSKVVTVIPDEITDETITMSKAKGGLKVYSNPPEADIFIENQYYGKTPKIIKNISAGEYLVLLSKTSYSDVKRKIKINADEYTEIDITLLKPASLSITSEPGNATVRVFSQEMGKTPLNMTNVYPGKVYIEIYYPGYKSEGKYIQLNESALVEEHFRLIKLPTLVIESNPTQANIYINNKLLGTTPLTVSDLTDDKITLEIKKNYYNDWQQELVLQSGKDEKINAQLTNNEGLFVIDSDPQGISISINDIKIGRTPINLLKSYGEYEITISDERYEPIKEQVVLSVPRIEKNYKLSQRMGAIKLSGLTKGVKVYLDGKFVSEESEDFRLPIGKHSIVMKKSGYKNLSESLNLQANKTQIISIFFTPKTKLDALVRSTFLPGWGQSYQEKRIRSWIYPIAIIGLGTGSYLTTMNYNDKVKMYSKIRDEYLSAFDPTDINKLWNQMDSAYNDVENAKNIRNIFYASTLISWLWNMLDTLILPPHWATNYKLTMDLSNNKNLVYLSFILPW